MKKLCMILSSALILCFIVGCQDKEAKAELEGHLGQQKRMEKFAEYVHELKGIYYVDVKVGGETDVQHKSTTTGG